MRLVADIEFKLGRETIRLRPSLRAAFTLDRKYDGFQNLYEAVVDGSFTAISDVLKVGSGQPTEMSDYLDLGPPQNEIEKAALMERMAVLVPHVSLFLLALTGTDENAAKAIEGEPVAFERFFTRVFQFGSGILGWTPEVTWNATIPEILNAYEGRKELIASIFGAGKSDDKTIDRENGKLDQDARDELNALGDFATTSIRQVS